MVFKHVASYCLVETCEEFGKTCFYPEYVSMTLHIFNVELFHIIQKFDITNQCKLLINLAGRQDNG